MILSLKNGELPNRAQWGTFLKIVSVLTGVSFLIAGVVFFFAFNWDVLSKFTKFSIVIGLLISQVLIGLYFQKKRPLLFLILQLTAMITVGVLFAVYGQVYQTGADAYDLFLSWLLAITLWVIVVNHSATTFLWLFLANLTATLYIVQVLDDSDPDTSAILLLMNVLVWTLGWVFKRKFPIVDLQKWMFNIWMVFIFQYLIGAIGYTIFEEWLATTGLITVLVLFTLTFLFIREKYLFGISGLLIVYAISLIFIMNEFLVDHFKIYDLEVVFLNGVVVILVVFGIIKAVQYFKEQWPNSHELNDGKQVLEYEHLVQAESQEKDSQLPNEVKRRPLISGLFQKVVLAFGGMIASGLLTIAFWIFFEDIPSGAGVIILLVSMVVYKKTNHLFALTLSFCLYGIGLFTLAPPEFFQDYHLSFLIYLVIGLATILLSKDDFVFVVGFVISYGSLILIGQDFKIPFWSDFILLVLLVCSTFTLVKRKKVERNFRMREPFQLIKPLLVCLILHLDLLHWGFFNDSFLFLPGLVFIISFTFLILNFKFGFHRGMQVFFIQCIYSFSKFYYDLQITLLVKSMILIGLGLLLLLVYKFVLERLYQTALE